LAWSFHVHINLMGHIWHTVTVFSMMNGFHVSYLLMTMQRHMCCCGLYHVALVSSRGVYVYIVLSNMIMLASGLFLLIIIIMYLILWTQCKQFLLEWEEFMKMLRCYITHWLFRPPLLLQAAPYACVVIPHKRTHCYCHPVQKAFCILRSERCNK